MILERLSTVKISHKDRVVNCKNSFKKLLRIVDISLSLQRLDLKAVIPKARF